MVGVDANSTNEDGLTVLHQCCIDDSEEMMKLLLEFNADVNAKDSEQWTPLHAAATCGYLHLVKYLISKGANLLAVNTDGNMPYDICEDDATLDYIESEMSKRGITQEMIDKTRASLEEKMLNDLKQVANADDLECKDSHGATPLHIAAANGYLSVIEFLLDSHIVIDSCDNDLWQPIHAAACWGHPECIEALVQAGADLNAKTKSGETPYDICEDPELKNRIMQLKNEMETRSGSQSGKLKRSHSQNTRSQSIRRTSIREKIQISRREAREEARLRQEKQECNEDEDEAKQQKDAKEYEKKNLSPLLNPKEILQSQSGNKAKDSQGSHEKISFNNAANKSNCAKSEVLQQTQPKQSNELENGVIANCVSDIRETSNQKSNVPNSEHLSSKDPPCFTGTPSVQNSGDPGVKVEIHVTVNTSSAAHTRNQGTLADLKKQRADQRIRNAMSSTTVGQEMEEDAVTPNGHNDLCTLNGPPSPSSSARRFHSDPEIVVGNRRKLKCCIIM